MLNTYRLVTTFPFLLSAIISFGQQPEWREIADNYINVIVADDFYLGLDLPDQLTSSLKQDYENLNIEQMHLLGVLVAYQNPDEAETYYQEVTSRYGGNPFHKALFILGYYRYGYTLEATLALQRTKEAIELLKVARQDSSLIAAHAYMDFGYHLLRTKDFEQSFMAFSTALAIAEKVGKSHPIYAMALDQLASYYDAAGNLEMTTRLRKQAELNELQESGINIPYPVLFKRRPQPATDLLKSSGEWIDSYRVALLLLNGEFNNPYNERLASLMLNDLDQHAGTEIRQLPFYGQFLVHKGLLDLSLANTDEAIKTFQKSITFFKRSESNSAVERFSGITNSLNGMGCAWYHTREWQKGLRAFQQCDSLFKSVKLLYGQDFIQHNILLTLSKLKDMKALHGVLESFRTGTVINQDFKERMTRYGDLMMEVGDYDGAFKFYTKAYDWFWSEVQFAYYEAKGNEDEYQEEGFDFINEENILMEIGPTEVIGAIHKYKPNGLHYRILLFKLAKAAFSVRKYDLARKYVLAYINEFYTEIENINTLMERGTDLYEIYRLKNELFPAYDLFQNILFEDHGIRNEDNGKNIMQAILQVLDSKANIQYEYRHMRATIEKAKDPDLKLIYEQYLEVRRQLVKAKLSEKLEQEKANRLSLAIDTLKAVLSERTALFAPVSISFTSWLDVRKSLKRKEAAIEIRRIPLYKDGKWSEETVYAAYIITPKSTKPEVVFLPEGHLLEGRYLKNYQNSIRYKLEDTISYDRFWKPIRDKIGRKTRKIYLAPDGVYNQINLNTLFNPERKRHLMEDLKFIHMISSKELTTTPQTKDKIQSVTLMGRPAYYIVKDEKTNPFEPIADSPDRALTREQLAKGSIEDLPGTEKEILSIQKIMSDKNIPTSYFIGDYSSEGNFKKSAGSIMHIATHGFWLQSPDDESADAMFHSGLLFSGVKNYVAGAANRTEEDGILTAYEVEGMDLDKTQLVVLSACETALGHIDIGEGVYGLQRAFKIAGVNAMIMSLWKVDDDATQELFVSFYSKWIGKNMPIEKAFFLAQDELKKKYLHPYYWGGFVLIQ